MIVELNAYVDFDQNNIFESFKQSYFKSRDEVHLLFSDSKIKVRSVKVGILESKLASVTVRDLSQSDLIDEIKQALSSIEVDSSRRNGISFVWEVESAKLLGEKYFHIGNGGLSVELLETSFGPKLRFRQAFLGSASSIIETGIEPEVISQLANFFSDFKNRKFKTKNCNAAQAEE